MRGGASEGQARYMIQRAFASGTVRTIGSRLNSHAAIGFERAGQKPRLTDEIHRIRQVVEVHRR